MANKLTPPPPTGIGILDRWLALLYRLLSAPGQLLKEQIGDFAHNHTADNDGGALTNDLHDGYVEVATSATPATPAAGKMRVFAEDAGGVARLRAVHSTGSNLAFFRDAVVRVKNTSGGTINKGEIVYCTGATGNFPTIAKAKANAASTMPAIGMVLTTAANNGFTTVQTAGEMTGLDTSAFAEGASLFVSATTAGALTSIEPQHPFLSQEIGFCTKSNAGAGSAQLFCTPAHEGDDFGSNRNTYKIGDGTAGAKVLGFVNAFLGSLSWNPTAARTLTLPDATGTLSTTTAAIDPVSVGATTPGSGVFTTLTSSGNTSLGTLTGDLLADSNARRIRKVSVLPAGYVENNPINFRFDQDQLRFVNRWGTATITAANFNASEIEQLFSAMSSFANLNGKPDNCAIEITGISISGGSDNTKIWPYIMMHSTGAVTPTVKMELLKSDAPTTWVEAFSGTVSTYKVAEYTSTISSLIGVRWTFSGHGSNNVYVRHLGVIGRNMDAYQWSVKRGGDTMYGPLNVKSTIATQSYTVATLPTAGTAGRMAYVTDATAPTYLGALTGGGAVVVPVFDNGTAWISH